MRASRSIDAALFDLFARRHGVASSQDLRAAGIDRDAVMRRVRADLMREVLPRVYAFGPDGATMGGEGQRLAAVLAAGPLAALGWESAARRHGLWMRSRNPDHVHVVTTASRRPDLRARWLTVHRSRTLSADDIEIVDGIATTTALRTCCDLGHVLTPLQIANVLHEATYRRTVDVDALEARLAELGRVRGTGAVRRAIALYRIGSAGTRSASEDRFHAGLVRRRLRRPAVNVRGATGVPGMEVDFVWPRSRLAVEIDGPGHDRPGHAENDALRDAELRAAGWTVLRFTTDQVWAELGRVLDIVTRHLPRR